MTYFEAGEWPVSYAGTGCSVFADSGMEDTQAQFEEIAVNLLWNWTNRIFGVLTETIRPCRVVTPWRPTTFEGMGPESAYYNLGNMAGWGWLPYLGDSGWMMLRCGIHGSQACACEPSTLKAIHLPGPVQTVTSVIVGALELPADAYRIDNKHTLIRQDGETWPSTQDLVAPLGSEDTWSVTFSRGVLVPMGGQMAAGLLACELYKSAIADPSCGLPSRIQSVIRQGVSMEMVQTTFQDLQDGKTGLFLVDNWVGSVTRPRTYVGIASPDTIRRNRWDLGYTR